MPFPDLLHLPVLVVDILRLCLWLTILTAIFVPLERLFGLRPAKIFRKQIGVDLGYYFLNALLPALLLSAPLGLLAWAVHQAIPTALLDATASLPLWAKLAAGLVAGEIGYYWGHRWSHEIPLLWRFHAIHHSAESMDFLVSTRAHPVDMVFGRFCGLVPIYAIGLGEPGAAGSLVPVLVSLLATLWGFFIHANLQWRFGWLEWLVTTPAFHHWHHTLDGPVNRNYASNLPWLDRIFGTHHLPANGWPGAYGIDTAMPATLSEQFIHPLHSPTRATGQTEPDRGNQPA